MDIRIKQGADNLTPSLDKIRRRLDALPREAYEVFREETPVRSGNARRNTKFRKDTIVADYAYAQRLDQGYSKKAKEGMWKPTIRYIKRRLREIMRKV